MAKLRIFAFTCLLAIFLTGLFYHPGASQTLVPPHADLTATIAKTGQFTSLAPIMNMEVSGSRAYLIDSNGLLEIVDVSSPVTPTLLGTYSGAKAADVAIAGQTAYVAELGLSILDISNPRAPVLTGRYPDTFSNFDVKVDASRKIAYTVGNNTKENSYPGTIFEAINIADPDHPALLGSYLRDYTYHFEINGSLAYVLHSDNTEAGVEGLDVSAPSKLIFPVAAWKTGNSDVNNANVISKSRDRLYFTVYDFDPNGQKYLRVADINPTAGITGLASYAYTSHIAALAAQEDLLALVILDSGTGQDQLNLYLTGDPVHFQQIQSMDLPWMPSAILLQGAYLYVAGGGGLLIYQISYDLPERVYLISIDR